MWQGKTSPSISIDHPQLPFCQHLPSNLSFEWWRASCYSLTLCCICGLYSTQWGGPSSLHLGFIQRDGEGISLSHLWASRGLSLLTLNLFYFDTIRENIPSHHVEPFPFRCDEGGYSSSCQIPFISMRWGGSPLVISNLFYFDMLRGNIPLLALNPFCFLYQPLGSLQRGFF